MTWPCGFLSGSSSPVMSSRPEASVAPVGSARDRPLVAAAERRDPAAVVRAVLGRPAVHDDREAVRIGDRTDHAGRSGRAGSTGRTSRARGTLRADRPGGQLAWREVRAEQRSRCDLRGVHGVVLDLGIRYRAVFQLRRSDAVPRELRGCGHARAAERDEQRQTRDHHCRRGPAQELSHLLPLSRGLHGQATPEIGRLQEAQ